MKEFCNCLWYSLSLSILAHFNLFCEKDKDELF